MWRIWKYLHESSMIAVTEWNVTNNHDVKFKVAGMAIVSMVCLNNEWGAHGPRRH